MIKNCEKCLCPSKDIVRGFCSKCYSWMRTHGGLKVLPKILLPETLSPYQEEVLTGLMLGDGFLELRDCCISPRLSLDRQIKDKEYLLWNADVFKEFLTPKSIKEVLRYNKTSKKHYPGIVCRTRGAPAFKKYYTQWYPHGQKIVRTNLVLTPTILMVWFLDDGSIHRTKNDSLSLSLCTNGFLKQEVEYLADLLYKRYNCYFGVMASGDTTKGRNYKIQTATSGSKAFLNEIENVMLPCMSRKMKWEGIDLLAPDKPSQRSKILNPLQEIILPIQFYEYLSSLQENQLFSSSEVVNKIEKLINIDNFIRIKLFIKNKIEKYVTDGYIKKLPINEKGVQKYKSYYLTQDNINYFLSQLSQNNTVTNDIPASSIILP